MYGCKCCCHLSCRAICSCREVVDHEQRGAKDSDDSRYLVVVEAGDAERETEHGKLRIAVLTCHEHAEGQSLKHFAQAVVACFRSSSMVIQATCSQHTCSCACLLAAVCTFQAQRFCTHR